MAKPKFNFQTSFTTPSEVASTVSESDAGTLAQTINTETSRSPLDSYKIIPRNKIRFNKRNDYPLDEIEKLPSILGVTKIVD